MCRGLGGRGACRSAAWQSDLRRFAGKTKGLLDGLPVVVKDNFCIAGNPATAGSRFLRDFTAPYSATGALPLPLPLPAGWLWPAADRRMRSGMGGCRML